MVPDLASHAQAEALLKSVIRPKATFLAFFLALKAEIIAIILSVMST